MEDLAKLIKEARERRGYTSQTAFAESVGMTQSKYNRIENGVVKEMPPPETLRLIGDALGVSMEDMLEAAGYLDPDPETETITIPVTDPRAKLLALIAHEDDAGVEWITGILERVLAVESLTRPR